MRAAGARWPAARLSMAISKKSIPRRRTANGSATTTGAEPEFGAIICLTDRFFSIDANSTRVLDVFARYFREIRPISASRGRFSQFFDAIRPVLRVFSRVSGFDMIDALRAVPQIEKQFQHTGPVTVSPEFAGRVPPNEDGSPEQAGDARTRHAHEACGCDRRPLRRRRGNSRIRLWRLGHRLVVDGRRFPAWSRRLNGAGAQDGAERERK